MKKSFRTLLWIAGIAIIVCIAIYALGSRPSTPARPAAKPVAATKAPATLEGDISRALGPSNRDVKRLVEFRIDNHVIFVTFAINDNLSEGLIKRSAQMDTVDILECVAKHNPAYKEAQLVGTFPLVDKFGNSEEAEVVWLTYSRTTVDKINFDRFLSDDAYAVADSVVLHPAFQ